MTLAKIAFGGGCHWCTESVFTSIKGVKKVDQGWIASIDEAASFSEGVIVHFDNEEIAEKLLIEIHLATHSAASKHSMRSKYRSAIYIFSDLQEQRVLNFLQGFQIDNDIRLVTQVLPMTTFKLNDEQYLDYLTKNKKSQFSKRYIHPKLKLVNDKFGNLKKDRINLINQ
tara:strand:- start:199 stop:708 length:510 start_codon:yes stop_codon:yes gene_type:complete